jgi:hypothetical protein
MMQMFACFLRLVAAENFLGTKVCLHPISLGCVTLQCPQIDGKYMQLMANQWTKQYGWRVHTMNELRVSFQGRGGDTDVGINFFWACNKNYSWQLHEGCNGRFDSLGSNIGPKPLPRYLWKANIKGFRLV